MSCGVGKALGMGYDEVLEAVGSGEEEAGVVPPGEIAEEEGGEVRCEGIGGWGCRG